jgi:hypothetical protein
MEHNKDQRHENQKLPEDVHNSAQDPNSMRDPLKQQLERSEGLNGPEQQRTLNKLREQYGDKTEREGQ